ncbi:hypothetical protein EC973_001080 [Apophysomyces ossiformis]|uniref:Xylanolytic transcriptional activator regulatory domain-containing protein n=1 Tax=Apophysomyces ossiformis TaxID=679940 RepID=A0A8H7BPV3_9FUNG|nr:hypothetical protein EC973_001080 [Apophysomyces ossiformis]
MKIYINSVFPLVHRATIKQAIRDRAILKPLLWAVMAIGARFSDHPSIKTIPPYLAGERFALKATSLIDATLMEPTMPNLQFWGIMACLEYGRAAASRAWVYGNLAVRFCQEMGLNKEDTLTVPILKENGEVDTVAMALRRRVYWSCICIDKFASAGTASPQCFDISDCDAQAPNPAECLALRDPSFYVTVDNKQVANDSLMDIAAHYMRLLLVFGEVNKCMNRAKSDSATIVWPPIPEFGTLDAKLRAWKRDLPDRFQFTMKNLEYHRENASLNYINLWLNSHAVYCSSMMVLHRGSLAFSDVQQRGLSDDVASAIRSSIRTCEMCVEAAMGVFRAMRDMCGFNVLPYMGYSAYIFATVLMTSTFSKGKDAYRQSRSALRLLYDLIEGLKPYWPMCERLANTTRDLLAAHSRLYEFDDQRLPYEPKDSGVSSTNYVKPVPLRQPSSSSPNYTLTHPSVPSASQAGSMTSLLASETTVSSSGELSYARTADTFFPSAETSPTPLIDSIQQQPTYNPIISDAFSATNGNSEINFNSLEFLYDSALFGQMIFDGSKAQPSVSVPAPSMDFSSTMTPAFTDANVVASTTFDESRLVQSAISTRPYQVSSDKQLWNSS